MKTADVAVIVPVFNRASLVLESLNSVVRQSLAPRRLLIVDDGSTDGSAAAVADWIATTNPAFDCILVCQPRNRGVAWAINCGLEMAGDCQYLAVLDSDDHWPTDFIERAYSLLAAHPEAVAATSDQLHIFDGSTETRFFDARAIEANAACWMFAKRTGIVSATIVQTRCVARAGGADDRLTTGYDAKLLLTLSLLGTWLHVPGSPVVIRRSRQQSAAETTHLSERFADNQRRWAKIHDDFIQRNGGKRVVPRRLYTRMLASRWDCAGQQLMQLGRAAEARSCFLRSLAWRPWRMKTWSQIAKTFVGSNGNRRTREPLVTLPEMNRIEGILQVHSRDSRTAQSVEI